jgi:hypothetical protein
MDKQRYIEHLKDEFKFNIDNISKYDSYTNVLWNLDFKESFKDSVELNNVEKAAVLSIQHKMLIIYLVSVFESLLQDSTEFILNISFKRFAESDKMQLSYSEIFDEANIEGLRRKVIDKELLKVAYKSVRDQLNVLSKDYNFEFIELSNSSTDLKFLMELFQFRNILLHNKGIINQIFIDNTDYPNHMLGDYFPIDEDYITDSITKIEYIGIKLLNRIEEKYIKQAANN